MQLVKEKLCMYIERNLKKHLTFYLKKYPVVTITGPRQSGKTTLATTACKDYSYVSLEDPDHLEYATTDPRGFLETYSNKVIFDEIQNAPKLFSYLQGIVDQSNTVGRYILSGSQQFLLNEKIPQTLAGRTARLTLLPFSISELHKRKPQTLWFSDKAKHFSPPSDNLHDVLWKGLYPRVHESKIPATQFYRDYVSTYVTRDLQQLLKVGDLSTFQTFLRMLAARCGSRLNLSSLGGELGIAHTTVKKWLSVLEASYIITTLEPYYQNFNKRLVKSPKIYFLDTGLLCYLLRIKDAKQLTYHANIGGIFETFVVSEFIKLFYHSDQEAPLYFWQERNGKEVDLMIEKDPKLCIPIQIKSTKTITNKLFDGLNHWLNMKDNPQKKRYLIYGGT